jgi:hypothetical protein
MPSCSHCGAAIAVSSVSDRLAFPRPGQAYREGQGMSKPSVVAFSPLLPYNNTGQAKKSVGCGRSPWM